MAVAALAACTGQTPTVTTPAPATTPATPPTEQRAAADSAAVAPSPANAAADLLLGVVASRYAAMPADERIAVRDAIAHSLRLGDRLRASPALPNARDPFTSMVPTAAVAAAARREGATRRARTGR